jgi:lysyl-tRNA synthetase class 2
MARAGRYIVAVATSLAILVATTGWLYVLRPWASSLGMHVHDALALDELSRRSGIPLVIYVAVWGLAGVLLGLVARWARADGLTAGLLLGPAVGGWLYALNGASILVVRQISAHHAFRDASTEQAVILPAVIAAIAGALLGTTRVTRQERSRTALAWLVAGVALLAAWDAVFPEHRRSLVAAFDPAHVHAVSKALVVPLAAVLFVTARSLARGSRRAWQVGVAVLTALLVLHVGRRFDLGAVVTGITVVALLARRADFRRRGDPASKPRVLMHALVAAAGILFYGFTTLWINRLMADQPYTLRFAAGLIGRALAGMSFHGSDHLSGPVSNWFPLTTFILGSGALAFVLAEWLAPWRYRLRQLAHERAAAHALVRAWGSDTLAPFALRADKSYFFADDRSAFLAYRVIGGVAIVAGDPVGPAGARRALVRAFVEFAHERGWRIAILGASEPALDVYGDLGLRALYHGDEAVVDTASFSLDGRPIRKVRQSVHRLARAGFTVKALRPSEIDPGLAAELERIAAAWRGAEPERGFAMSLDAFFRLGDDDAVFFVGFDPDGAPAGALHFCISHSSASLSLSTMPRRRDVPNGFNEWLICASIAWAREHSYRRVSLNFSPFAALLAPDTRLTWLQRLEAAALRRSKGWFQLDSLLVFNRKFLPTWERRYVVYERRRDLPRVGLAALAAESYLPFQ